MAKNSRKKKRVTPAPIADPFTRDMMDKHGRQRDTIIGLVSSLRSGARDRHTVRLLPDHFRLIAPYMIWSENAHTAKAPEWTREHFEDAARAIAAAVENGHEEQWIYPEQCEAILIGFGMPLESPTSSIELETGAIMFPIDEPATLDEPGDFVELVTSLPLLTSAEARKIAGQPVDREQFVASYRRIVPGDRCNCGDGAKARGCKPGAIACAPSAEPADDDVVDATILCGDPVGAFGPCMVPLDGNGHHPGMHNHRADRSVI